MEEGSVLLRTFTLSSRGLLRKRGGRNVKDEDMGKSVSSYVLGRHRHSNRKHSS